MKEVYVGILLVPVWSMAGFKYEFESDRTVVNNPDVADPLVKSKVMLQSLKTIVV